MKKLVACLFTTLLVSVLTVVSSGGAHASVAGDTEGCTPGYWKQSQHFWAWQETQPGRSFVSAFSPSGLNQAPMAPVGIITGDLTMLQALNLKGGSTLDGKRQILARAATAAWLNASYDEGSHMQFPWRRWTSTNFNGVFRPALVPTVVSTLSGSDGAAMVDLAARIDADNNLGCPLGNAPAA